MTIQDANEMLFNGIGPQIELTFTPYFPPQIAPQTEDKMSLVEMPTPVTEKSFNQLSIDDIEGFHKFKDMDTLHRADAVAAQYEKGARLNDYFGEKVNKAKLNLEQTAELIRSHYFKK